MCMGLPKIRKFTPRSGKMGGDREPVRPRTDNRYIDDFSHDTRYV